MKKLFFALTTACLCSGLFAQDEVEMEKMMANERHAHESKISFRSNPLTAAYDLKYHRFEWDLNPNFLYMKGAVTTYFESNIEALTDIYFDLSDSLSVDSVTYHGQNLNYLRPGNHLLQILLPTSIPKQILDSLTIFYQGIPKAITERSAAMRIRVHGPDTVPVFFGISEPYGAVEWRPCKMDLLDKADSIDVIVKTPATYRTASNGVLVAETLEDTFRTCHWKHRYPIAAYLVGIAVTNYVDYSDYVPLANGDSVRIQNFVYPEREAEVRLETARTVDFMKFYNSLFGDYPFADEKYGHAQCNFGGGMEHTTMSFMGTFSPGVNAHELAHQWFGNKVTCGSWHDIWLNESFATYLEGLTYEAGLRFGPWTDWRSNKFRSVTSRADGSVFVPDTTDAGRIFSSRLSYNKGALVLHMLRWKTGDDAFFQGLRNYLNDPDLVFGFARTIDLQRHLEATSGQNLTEFFADWFYGEGHPVYTVEWWRFDSERVRVRLSQAPTHLSVSFFEMPVPIQLFGSGRDTIVVADHTESGQVFTFSPGFEVDSVKFDPQLWLLAELNEILINNDELPPFAETVRLFPNPASDFVHIEAEQPFLTIDFVEIFNVTGQRIRVEKFSERNHITLKTNDLPAGFYSLKIHFDNRYLIQKTFTKY